MSSAWLIVDDVDCIETLFDRVGKKKRGSAWRIEDVVHIVNVVATS